VRARADECFALACPVAELAWIDNWQFHLLYSDSGRNEEGNRIILERGFEARVANMLRFLSRSATHFMESGDILRLPARRKARLALLLLSAVVGRHVGRWLPSTRT
jgi:hypothetical protein